MPRIPVAFLLVLVATITGCPMAPLAVGCEGDEDCPAGNTCVAGACAAEGEGELLRALPLAPRTIDEDAPLVVALTVTGGDAGPVTWRSSSPTLAGATVSIDGDELTWRGPANVGDVGDTLTLTPSQGGVDGEPTTLTISVVAVNDPPIVTLSTTTVLGIEDNFGEVLAFAAADPGPDPGDTVTLTLTFDDDLTGLFDAVPALDENGTLSWMPAANRFFEPLAGRVVATDGGGATAELAFTLEVAPVNDPPRFTTNGVTVLEDGSVVGEIVATDISAGPFEAGDIRFVVGNVDGSVFDSATAVTIGADGRLTSGQLLANANGPAQLQITAVDDQGASLSGIVDVVVTAVNDLPVFRGPLALATPTNTAKSFALDVTDVDGDDIAVGVLGNPPAFTNFAISGTRVTLTPTSATANGRSPVTLSFSDGKGVVTRSVSVAVLGPQPSCFHYRAQNASVGDAVYGLLQPQDAANGCNVAGGCPYTAFCDMQDGDVGDDRGGWTLVLKADGNGDKWEFDDNRWTDATILDEDPTVARRSDLIVGQAGGIDGEAKLRSYLHVRVDELRVGFAPHTTNSRTFTFVPGNMPLALSAPATSMRALMSANSQGFFAVNQPDKQSWLNAAVEEFALQDNCNLRGLNVRANVPANQVGGAVDRVRIGILSNNENNCDTPDSYVGIGSDLTDSNVAGNRTNNNTDQSRHGAVLVRSTDLTDVGPFASCDAVIAAGFIDEDAVYLVNGQRTSCAP